MKNADCVSFRVVRMRMKRLTDAKKTFVVWFTFIFSGFPIFCEHDNKQEIDN